MNGDQTRINFDSPQELTKEESLVLSLIQPGRGNARQVNAIAEATGIHWRIVQKIVRRLIDDHGVCIGSTSGVPAGYYLITDPAEIENVYHSLRHRGIQILMRAGKLKKISVSEVFGQGKLLEAGKYASRQAGKS